MEVILLESIAKLGELGDSVSVKPGYARNYLLPMRKAMRATPEAREEVERRREQLLVEEKERLDVAKARAELAVKELKFTRSVIDSTGRLFGSVSTVDVVDAAAEAGTELTRSEIILTDGTIKMVGDYQAKIQLHPEVEFDIEIHVEADNPEVLDAVDSESESESDAEPAEDSDQSKDTESQEAAQE